MAINPNNIPLALTYDDVLLVPQRSRVQSRKQVDTSGRITRNIKLNVPIVGANMDSCSSATVAIALAIASGIGILQRFNTIEEMCNEIKIVKRHDNLKIKHPHTTTSNQSVFDATKYMKDNGISGLPVVDNECLIGMFTRRDVESAKSGKQLVKDVMTPRSNLIVGGAHTTLSEAQKLMSSKRVEKLPLVDERDNLIGLITKKDIKKQKLFPLATKDQQGRLMVGAAVGVRGDYIERAKACEDAGADFLCLDIAHGHADHAIDAIKELKKAVNIDILAGNVATAQACEDLIAAGADGIKAGVGGGSTCVTRLVAGTGVPMIQTVLDCASVCHKHGVPLCADGGIRRPGDVTKAIACGADTVMIGNLLAGTDESPGKLLKRNGKLLKVHRGMASAGAMEKRKRLDGAIVERSLSELMDEAATFNQAVPEGIEATVAYSGPARDVLAELNGGLKSGMSYSDSFTISEFHQKAQMVRVTNAGLVESHPHDVNL